MIIKSVINRRCLKQTSFIDFDTNLRHHKLKGGNSRKKHRFYVLHNLQLRSAVKLKKKWTLIYSKSRQWSTRYKNKRKQRMAGGGGGGSLRVP